MLFHSQEFLLIFLPVALIGWYSFAENRVWRNSWMIMASWAFYAYWDIRLLPLLIISTVANWILAGWALGNNRKWAVPAGIALNLSILAYFKYANFFAETLFALVGSEHASWSIILPLGISFFTFQQISYLADIGRGKAPAYRFDDYALYVSFFPQLIAGPIVRHDEVIPVFSEKPNREGLGRRFSIGFLLLTIGILKKSVFANTYAESADLIFSPEVLAAGIAAVDAWTATAAFGLQIYYDFSGYSDMAIGLAMMAGIALPWNFDAPYRSASLVDFWRRWHMTLSRFLRDYLYIPLGGGRAGKIRHAIALATTMFLGGLWHGAAWTFVVWGLLHGIGLTVVHMWRRTGIVLPYAVSWLLTILFVFLVWVIFRAESVSDALTLWQAMFGVSEVAETSGQFENLFFVWGAIGVGLLLAVLGPTSQVIAFEMLRPRRLFSVVLGIAFAALFFFLGTGENQEFIYFQF